MVFNSELVQVSKVTKKYMNLKYGEKGTITFRVKDAYSHFGVSCNKKFKNYSISIRIDDELFDRLKAVKEKVGTFLDQPLLRSRSLVEDKGYKNLYLKLGKDEFNKDMLDEGKVLVNAIITITAVYLGCDHPSLLVCVDEIDITEAPPPQKPVRVVIE